MTSTNQQLLWHYTSIETAVNILLGRTLWVSHSAFLNDSSEFYFGLRTLKNLSDKIISNKKPVDNLIEPNPLPLYLEELEDGANNPESINGVYITSFSEKQDLLSMWRAYTPNGGCAIGFDKECLENTIKNKNFPETTLKKCLYVDDDTSTIEKELRSILDKISSPLPSQSSPGSKWKIEVNRLLSQVKNPFFKEECEWRLVVPGHSPSDIQFSASFKPHLVIPFEKEEFSLMIKEIQIAPHSSSDYFKRYFRVLKERLTEEWETDDLFDVTLSQGPYRG